VLLPHVDPAYVIRPAVALATLAAPVDFGFMVEQDRRVPVRLVIMLALDVPRVGLATRQRMITRR